MPKDIVIIPKNQIHLHQNLPMFELAAHDYKANPVYSGCWWMMYAHGRLNVEIGGDQLICVSKNLAYTKERRMCIIHVVNGDYIIAWSVARVIDVIGVPSPRKRSAPLVYPYIRMYACFESELAATERELKKYSRTWLNV